MSFLVLADVQARVSNNLSDAALQDLIDEEEAYLKLHVGVLAGSRTETFDLPRRPTVTGLYLRRSTDSVTLTGGGTAIPSDDFTLSDDGFLPSQG